ncbi:MAG TPA: hypothetical protein VJO35_16670 [Terriglobales bacterium]|nr:hypothetical protein [Terriglobales bacterium]
MDFDIVIAATREQIRNFVGALPADEYYVDLGTALDAYSRESLFNVIDSVTGWKIDFIFRKSRTFSQEEFRRRKLIDFQGLQLFVATAEDVIIAKLEWAKLARSHRQLEDVAGILRLRSETLDHRYITKWVGELDLTTEWQTAQGLSAKNLPQ